MTAVPSPLAVTTPFASTVAMLLLLVPHSIPSLTVFEGVRVAESVVVAPYFIVDSPEIAIDFGARLYFAYSVISPLGVYVSSAPPMRVPPTGAVYQPINVAPLLSVAAGKVTDVTLPSLAQDSEVVAQVASSPAMKVTVRWSAYVICVAAIEVPQHSAQAMTNVRALLYISLICIILFEVSINSTCMFNN